MSVGSKIKNLRIKKKISQKDFAKLLNMPVSTLANYENNHREPRLDTLKTIAKVLNVDLNELLKENTLAVIKTDSSEYKIAQTFHTLIESHKYAEEEINELMDSILECFQILFLPVETNPKEFQKENLNILNETLFNIKELIELDVFLSAYKHPETYMENSDEIIKEILSSISKLRLYRFSKKREYRKNDL